jgi:MoaA/NifB/PqqE/SkfB family radical SAM enzyme
LHTADVFRIVDQLADMGTQRIGLSGGEPLLRDDIGEIIRHIKGKGIECGLSSNGILVPERLLEIRGVDSICLSLDGDKHVHEDLRGKGTYQKVMRAVQCVKVCMSAQC